LDLVDVEADVPRCIFCRRIQIESLSEFRTTLEEGRYELD
jgi:hypothetical protein